MRHVFVVSLHRSATQSVHNLLVRSGFSAKHWPARMGLQDLEAQCAGHELDPDFVADRLAPVFERYQAVSDVPLPGIYDALLRRYPDARFVAIYRSPFAWVRSARRHVGTRPLDVFERVQYWRYLSDRPASLEEVSDDRLVGMHLQHHADLLRTLPPESFRLFDAEAEGVGEAICEFLGTPPLPMERHDYLQERARILAMIERGEIKLDEGAG